MKYKFNPLTWEFNLVPDSGTLIQKLNWLTGNFNLTKDASKYKQIYNAIEGEFNLRPATTQIVVHWVWSVQLTNAAKNWLLSLKAYGWTEQRSRLPSEYTQLEYAIIPSWWYLTTDFVPTYDCKVEFEFTTTTLWTSWATTYLWVRPSTTWNGWLRCARISTKVFRIYGFGSYQDSTDTATANTRYKFTWDNQRWIITTGSTTVFDKTYSDTWSNTYPLTINGWNSAGTVTPWAEDIYVHSFKAWDNQWVLSANYIPCVYNNEVGFYDTVSESFKWATAWTFTAWPNVTPTPEQPIDIVSNNGVIKFSKNLANMVLPNVVEQYYIDNSWNILSSPVNFYYDTFIPVSPNTAYTLSGSKNFRYASLMEYDINQVFLKRTLIDNANTNAKTWTTRSDTAYIRFWSNPWSNETMTIDVVQSYNFQFERWSVPTPYHEYVEWWIYTNWTTETIWSHTKNLFSGTVEQGGLGDSSGAESQSSVRIRSTYIPVKPDTQYNLSWTTNSEMAVNIRNTHFYDASNTWISRLNAYAFTTPSNAAYVRFVWQFSNPNVDIIPSDISNIQLELGNTATTYVPYYDGGTATAEMLLAFWDTKDVQEVLSWSITRSVWVKVLDWTEEWTKASWYTWIFYCPISWAYYNDESAERLAILCTHFLGTDATNRDMANETIKLTTQWSALTNPLIYIKTTAWSDNLDNFKARLTDQYLNWAPVIVVYPLKTPTTESVEWHTMNIPSWNSTIEITQASLDDLELEATYEQDI